MKVFNVKNRDLLGVLFPFDKNTGEVKHSYDALQVVRYEGEGFLCLTVDGVTHTLCSGSFVYGLVIHPQSDVEVHFGTPFKLYCYGVPHPCPDNPDPYVVVEQPADEADAYDAFLQAQKLVHQSLYASDIDPDDDDDLDGESILSDYDEDEIPTPYELATDPAADLIEDRIRRAPEPAGQPEPPAVGSDVPPAKPTEEAPPKE